MPSTSSAPPASLRDSTSKLRLSLDALAKTLPPPSVCETALHEAIKASERAFAACRYVGVQRLPDGKAFTLRNCNECGSTLAKEEK